MSTGNRLEKEQYWREQLALAEKREGSLESYCRSQNLAIHTLRYWKEKFRQKEKKSSDLAVSPFIAVEVKEANVPGSVRNTPDPQWCAEFVRQLFAGAR